jgi:hypothetical protein
MEKTAKQDDRVAREQLLTSLESLVSLTCQSGDVQSQVDAQGVSVTLRFGKDTDGGITLARDVAALLAQATM